MLYLVATPIGNLADITFRAIEILKSCDYILCEDTRHSKALLFHYQIHKPLKSYHKHNEAMREEEIISDLAGNRKIALISDAGTPGISDPGARLVRLCVERKIPLMSIPGPCAAIQALSCSGLDTERFQFLGFLPKKQNELKKVLAEILNYSGTTICYESPQRLIAVLEQISLLTPQRQVVISRELTKKFEENWRGTASDLFHRLKNQSIKGEIVLMIAKAEQNSESKEWVALSLEEHVQQLQDSYHLSLTEAIKLAAKLRGSSRREIYQKIHSLDATPTLNDENK